MQPVHASITTTPPPIQPGDHIAVRNTFTRTFAVGFIAESVTAEGIRVRRERDGLVLPVAFAEDDVEIIVGWPAI